MLSGTVQWNIKHNGVKLLGEPGCRNGSIIGSF